jgi:GxxExxY protein
VLGAGLTGLQDKAGCSRCICKNSRIMKEEEITFKVIGCAMKVHNTLGNGFQEVIYQRCLAIELEKAGLKYGREIPRTIFYEGADVGTRRADFIVERKIIVETKAVINLEDVHLAQAKNYVVAYDFPTGLLINFGAVSLQYKKVFNSKYNLEFANKKRNASRIISSVYTNLTNDEKSNPANP